MKQITYLFGAGASCKSLPIVNQIPNRLKLFIEKLSSTDFALSGEEGFTDLKIPGSKNDLLQCMIEDLKWLHEVSLKHASIDTFAKKLFLKKGKSKELNKLKHCLSVFFTCEQILNNPDPRYDSFFASIITESAVKLPANINIVSWNYDNQFELAYADYVNADGIFDVATKLNIQSIEYKPSFNTDSFSINRLNGSVGIYTKTSYMPMIYNDLITADFDKTFIENLVRTYSAGIYHDQIYTSSISFAWEDSDEKKTYLSELCNHIASTNVLIIIGYSFPFFNREIDRKIIGSMKNIEKVYFQAPDADNIKERFQAIRDDLDGKILVTRFDLDQFLLPNEL